jgi:hypothetical protein
VYVFTDPSFPKAPHATKVTHKVTSVVGHVFSVDFPPQFQSWDSVDPAELFNAPVIRKPCKGSVVKHLQDEAKGVNFIVLWMDCDRYVSRSDDATFRRNTYMVLLFIHSLISTIPIYSEGENINFEVLDCCSK